MKQFLLVFLVTMLANTVRSQNVGINETGAAPDPSAILDVSSDSLGFLPPRITEAARDLIPSPAHGLLIFNLTTGCFNQYDTVSVSWLKFCGDHECPAGFIEVRPGLSIEQDERYVTTWFDAVSVCNTIGARLCTWSEWYIACSTIGGSLNDMTDHWEWVDDGVGDDSMMAVGRLGCANSNAQGNSVQATFRCCCDH